MSTATLTSKGQITIPVGVEFIQIAPGRYEFVAVTHSVKELKGMFGKPAKTVSIEEMNKAIAIKREGISTRHLVREVWASSRSG
ncbi:MAG: AbrB family transcriptional regulator [Oxalobacteraceae bacterium]|nr:AbrB family transcriptional regulator [Oxalobacteraceae bacterium]